MSETHDTLCFVGQWIEFDLILGRHFGPVSAEPSFLDHEWPSAMNVGTTHT
jgi:hypothetical protein